MSDKQKEAVTNFYLGSRYKAIACVFDSLPPRFQLRELMKMAQIKDGKASRSAVATILSRDFKCVNVVHGPLREWKKP